MSEQKEGTILFRDLSKDARIMYSTIYRCINRKTKKCFPRINVLAEYAGLNHYSAVYAIKELIDKGVIERESRQGHSSIYKLLQELPLCNPVAQGYHPTSSTGLPPPVAQGYHITTDLNMIYLTTTDTSLKSYNQMVKEFGKDVVDVAVVNCKKLNGDVRNFWGLVRWSCKTGIAPTNKTSQQKEAREKHAKFVDEQIEKSRRQQEELERAVAESDPELPNRLIAEFMMGHVSEVEK